MFDRRVELAEKLLGLCACRQRCRALLISMRSLERAVRKAPRLIGAIDQQRRTRRTQIDFEAGRGDVRGVHARTIVLEVCNTISGTSQEEQFLGAPRACEGTFGREQVSVRCLTPG